MNFFKNLQPGPHQYDCGFRNSVFSKSSPQICFENSKGAGGVEEEAGGAADPVGAAAETERAAAAQGEGGGGGEKEEKEGRGGGGEGRE
jgi:hypothetical protein